MDPSQSNDGSHGAFPGGNNPPYPPATYLFMYGYQMPPWYPPQPQQGFQQIQPNVPLMYQTNNGAEAILPPAERGDASLETDGADIEEVLPPSCTGKGWKKKTASRIKLTNFNPNEDVILMKAYAEIGDDPITNTGKKKIVSRKGLMNATIHRGEATQKGL